MSPNTRAQFPPSGHNPTPTQPINFMGLPAEVRLMVYELSLVAPDRPLLRSREEMISTYQRGELAASEERPLIKDPELFNYQGLPPRLRAKVQAECYAAGSRAILTSRDEMIGPPARAFLDRNARYEGSQKAKIPLANTVLLQLSKQTHDEAASVFYGKNRFHYTVTVSDDHHKLLPFSRNLSFLQHLPFMKHISLDLGDCIDNFWRKHYTSIAERILPPYLHLIEQCCMRNPDRALKSLDLSLMSLPADDTYLDSEPNATFNNPLAVPGPTSRALRSMRHYISTTTIVGIGSSGPQHVLTGFCSEIAPEREWRKETWTAWKGKSLNVVPVRRLPEFEHYLHPEHGKSEDSEAAVHCWRLGNTAHA